MAYDFKTLKDAIKESEEWLNRELGGGRTGRRTGEPDPPQRRTDTHECVAGRMRP